MFLVLTVVALATFLLFYFKKSTERPPGFPPGLPRFPWVGSSPLLTIFGQNGDMFPALSRAMGPIVGLYLGSRPAVLLSDAELIREAFKQDAISDRLITRPANELKFGEKDGKARGVMASSGSEWQEQRRFVLRNLRDFGFGKASMDDLIISEVDKLIQHLSKEEGVSINLNMKMNLSILNALWVILTGEEVDLDDQRLKDIIELFSKAIRPPKHTSLTTKVVGLIGIPWLTKRFSERFQGIDKAFKEIYDVVEKILKRHKTEFDPHNPKDFMDVYYNHLKKCKDPTSSFYGDMGEKSMKVVYADLFVAGMETTASSLLWAFFFMLKYPEIKKRLQKELDSVVGNRQVTMGDQQNLPFLQAVLNETQRLGSIVPLAPPHLVAEDTTIAGHHIPKGTVVLANLMYVHHDPYYWSDAQEFKPDRFLSEDGSQVVSDDHLIPFSVGKRVCLGQTLAEREFFLFFANIMNHFEIDTKDDLATVDLLKDSVTEITRTPPNYSIVLTKRK